MDFFETRMGKYFYEGSVPRIAAALERIAAALEKQNTMAETEIKESKKALLKESKKQ
jgi:hypothetical protein